MSFKILIVLFSLCSFGFLVFIGNNLLLARRKYTLQFKVTMLKKHRRRSSSRKRRTEPEHEETPKQENPFFLFWWLRQYARSLFLVCTLYLLVCAGFFLVRPLTGARTNRYTKQLPNLNKEQKERWKNYVELSVEAEKNSQDADLQLELARAQVTLGLAGKAKETYRKVLYLRPHSVEALYELGLTAIALKDITLAKAEQAELTTRWPKRPEPYLLQAHIEKNAGNHSHALALLRVALGKDPENLSIRIFLTETLIQQKEYAEAAHLAEEGLRQLSGTGKKPKNATINTLVSVEKTTTANHAKLYLILAKCRVGLKQYADAEASLRNDAAMDLSSPFPFVMLGDLMMQRGAYSRALAAYEDALKRAPDDHLIMNNIASLSIDHGFDLTRATNLAARMYASHPADPAVADTLGWATYLQGKTAAALPLLQQGALGMPGNPTHHYHLGAALLTAGQTEKGKHELATALKLSGSFDGAGKARELLQKK